MLFHALSLEKTDSHETDKGGENQKNEKSHRRSLSSQTQGLAAIRVMVRIFLIGDRKGDQSRQRTKQETYHNEHGQ